MSQELPRFLTTQDHSHRLASRQQHCPRRVKAGGLWVLGSCGPEQFESFSVAIVGTRRPTAQGLRKVREVVSFLREFRCSIISGGALGIDGEAHLSALRHGIPTQAWLVGPLTDPSPKFHRNIFEALEKTPGCGLIVPERLEPSEERPPIRRDWVERNQWLAAAADMLIVVEAQWPSGTATTVDAAHDYGIPIFLFSGPPGTPQSEGVNRMNTDGSGFLVQEVKEVAERMVVELGASFYNQIRYPGVTSGPGGGLSDPSAPFLENDLLVSLREILNQPEGLNWEGVWNFALRHSISIEKIRQHISWMIEQGELQGSGDCLERRG